MKSLHKKTFRLSGAFFAISIALLVVYQAFSFDQAFAAGRFCFMGICISDWSTSGLTAIDRNDSDGDGIINQNDSCDNTSAQGTSNGCPTFSASDISFTFDTASTGPTSKTISDNGERFDFYYRINTHGLDSRDYDKYTISITNLSQNVNDGLVHSFGYDMSAWDRFDSTTFTLRFTGPSVDISKSITLTVRISDRDGDGVSDRLDMCPDYNGNGGDGGCPEPSISEPFTQFYGINPWGLVLNVSVEKYKYFSISYLGQSSPFYEAECPKDVCEDLYTSIDKECTDDFYKSDIKRCPWYKIKYEKRIKVSVPRPNKPTKFYFIVKSKSGQWISWTKFIDVPDEYSDFAWWQFNEAKDTCNGDTEEGYTCNNVEHKCDDVAKKACKGACLNVWVPVSKVKCYDHNPTISTPSSWEGQYFQYADLQGCKTSRREYSRDYSCYTTNSRDYCEATHEFVDVYTEHYCKRGKFYAYKTGGCPIELADGSLITPPRGPQSPEHCGEEF